MRSADRDPQAGLTMVEIMVSLLLVSVAAAFVFSIQMRTSTALRDQQAIAEMQQTLRSASDQLVRDLRTAGYLARRVRISNPAGSGAQCTPDDLNLFELEGLSVVNSNSAPDLVRVVSADSTTEAAVVSFGASETTVDDVAGFAIGDTIMVVSKTNDLATRGLGCVLWITAVDTAGNVLTHSPGTEYNATGGGGNCQCQLIFSIAARDLLVTRANVRAYRVSPSDARGVLQMSPTAGIKDDWVDMAVGIVDLQMALRQQLPDSTGDGVPERSWLSGANMETALDPVGSLLLTASVTLVAKTNKEVNGVVLPQTPDLFEADAGADTNRVGDRAGTTLPVTDNTSMYYGEFVYRSYTSTVDLRNMGIEP